AITLCFCIHDTATSALSPLSLHDALPISRRNSGFRRFTVHPPEGLIRGESRSLRSRHPGAWWTLVTNLVNAPHSCNDRLPGAARSEEHTSELQSRENLVCRLLLEKKKIQA